MFYKSLKFFSINNFTTDAASASHNENASPLLSPPPSHHCCSAMSFEPSLSLNIDNVSGMETIPPELYWKFTLTRWKSNFSHDALNFCMFGVMYNICSSSFLAIVLYKYPLGNGLRMESFVLILHWYFAEFITLRAFIKLIYCQWPCETFCEYMCVRKHIYNSTKDICGPNFVWPQMAKYVKVTQFCGDLLFLRIYKLEIYVWKLLSVATFLPIFLCSWDEFGVGNAQQLIIATWVARRWYKIHKS